MVGRVLTAACELILLKMTAKCMVHDLPALRPLRITNYVSPHQTLRRSTVRATLRPCGGQAPALRALIRIVPLLLVTSVLACQPSARPPVPDSSSAPQLLGPTVLPISDPVPGAPGALVYAVPGGLWALEPSTKAKRELVTLPKGALPAHPAASPDGKLLAFGLYQPAADRQTPGGTDLHVAGRDGSGMRVVVAHDEPLSYASEPAWAPDGQSLYFTYRTGSGTTRLERVNLDGSGRMVVVRRGENPTVSPDGRRLGYVRSEPPTFIQHIWVAAIDGSGARSVLDGKDFDSLATPRFSRDGDRVIFAAVGGPGLSVPPQAYAPPLGQLVGLSVGRRGGPNAWWRLPAGDFGESAATGAHGVPWDIWAMRADGSDLKRLTQLGEDGPVPVWSPDGRWIAFSGELGIYLMKPDGKDLVRLSDEWVPGGLTWMP